MALIYLKLDRNCPLHIIALVVRGRVAELTISEKDLYWKFTSFLYEKLLRDTLGRTVDVDPTQLEYLLDKYSFNPGLVAGPYKGSDVTRGRTKGYCVEVHLYHLVDKLVLNNSDQPVRDRCVVFGFVTGGKRTL